MADIADFLPDELGAALHSKDLRPTQAEVVTEAVGHLGAGGHVSVCLPQGLDVALVSQTVMLALSQTEGDESFKALILLPGDAEASEYLARSDWLAEHLVLQSISRADARSSSSMSRLVESSDVLVTTARQMMDALQPNVITFSQLGVFELVIVDAYGDPQREERLKTESESLIQSLVHRGARVLYISAVAAGQGTRKEPWSEIPDAHLIRVKGPARRREPKKKAKTKWPPSGSRRRRPAVRFEIAGSITWFERILWITIVVGLVLFDLEPRTLDVLLERGSSLFKKLLPVMLGLILLMVTIRLLVSFLRRVLDALRRVAEVLWEELGLSALRSRPTLRPSLALAADRSARTGERVPRRQMGEDGDPAAWSQFASTYELGEDLYDESFSIETPLGEFLGECGVGISEILGTGEPNRVTAFEVWLFDKGDILTATKVLMSEYAFNDDALRSKLASRGEAVLAQPGSQFKLETSALEVQVAVGELIYDWGDSPANSVFSRLALELLAGPVGMEPADRTPITAIELPEEEFLPSPDRFTESAGSFATAGEQAWSLPSVDEILRPATAQELSQIRTGEQVQIIEGTLSAFGIPAKVVEVKQGPTATQFDVEPGHLERWTGDGGVKRIPVRASGISALANDLALALAVSRIRVETPVAGQSFARIEVLNAETVQGSLPAVLASHAFRQIRGPLPVALGQDATGNPVAIDLADMPHLLIAGAAGSGKSACVNGIIASLLCTRTPDQVQFIMAGLGMAKLRIYGEIPHLRAPVVVELEQAVSMLNWATREMDERYMLFATDKVPSVEVYNRQRIAEGKSALPYLVIVIDELAGLMMAAPDEVERSICRIAQTAQATGIHLIIATQRPSVEVVTALIKANIPARISLAVASQTDSRVILDTGGAERLLGRGDMLFMAPDSARSVRLQGCFVSREELAGLVRYWQGLRLAREPRTLEELVQEQPPGESETVPAEATPGDELLPQAVALVRELERASISMLQRYLHIGYPRARRLMDTMEQQGIVGPYRGGGQPRQVRDGAP